MAVPRIRLDRTPTGRKYGRNTLWKAEFLDLATTATARLGATDEDLAHLLKVTIHTIDHWKRHKPAFMKAIKRGKAIATQKVEKSFFERATGYTHDETIVLPNRVKIYGEENGKKILIEERTEPLFVRVKKHYPPDSYAAHKWLTAQDRENWADIQTIHNINDINIRLEADLSQVPTELLESLKHVAIHRMNETKQLRAV